MNEAQVTPHPLDEYQAWVATKMRRLPTREARAAWALGLAGEAGEFADVIKKELYHDKPIPPQHEKGVKSLELGDVLFYIAANCVEHGLSLRNVLEMNIYKLNDRYPKGFNSEQAHAPTTGQSTEWPDTAGQE